MNADSLGSETGIVRKDQRDKPTVSGELDTSAFISVHLRFQSFAWLRGFGERSIGGGMSVIRKVLCFFFSKKKAFP
jgi:hypothetical protein